MSKKALAAKETQNANETPRPPQAAGQDGAASNNFGDLDRVRSILFGAQSQELEQGIQQLEARLEQERDALRETMTARFEALDATLKKDKEALKERLAAEKKERHEAEKELAEEIKSVDTSLEKKSTQLREHITTTENTLQARLVETSSTAEQNTSARFEALTQHLEDAVAELRNAKTDRLALADLFDQLATHLRKKS